MGEKKLTRWVSSIKYHCWDAAKEHGVVYIIDGDCFDVTRKTLSGAAWAGMGNTLEAAKVIAEQDFEEWLGRSE